MTLMRARLATVLALGALAAALGYSGEGRAAGLQFEPVYLHLSPARPTATLHLTNHGATVMRYQVTPYSWSQSPSGETQVAETSEVILFPMMFSLQPDEETVVRIGTTTKFVSVEKTYRLYIDEFPPQEAEGGAGLAVRIRSRVDLPIFLDPPEPRATGRVAQISARDGKLVSELRSTGSAHLLFQAVEVAAFDGGGKAIFQRRFGPGYLLAGGVRQFDVAIPTDLCGEVRSVRVQAQRAVVSDVVQAPLERTVSLTGACGP